MNDGEGFLFLFKSLLCFKMDSFIHSHTPSIYMCQYYIGTSPRRIYLYINMLVVGCGRISSGIWSCVV